VNQSGEISGLVAGRVLVQASGSASAEEKTALLGTMDFAGLESYDK
ncbi:MAG: hypothetical protein GYB53_04890, partial [Rhodobacteraceae bacterium]|nr:hypothetical protein [Paracoccaceae bacterium]